MLKKSLCLLIVVALSSLKFHTPTHVSAQTVQDAQVTAKLKADVAAIGVGSRVSIKLRDKGKLIGYISQIGDEDFQITKAKEGTKQTIAYANAVQVTVKNEKRISTAGKILIVWGVLGLVGMIATGGGG